MRGWRKIWGDARDKFLLRAIARVISGLSFGGEPRVSFGVWSPVPVERLLACGGTRRVCVSERPLAHSWSRTRAHAIESVELELDGVRFDAHVERPPTEAELEVLRERGVFDRDHLSRGIMVED